MYISNLPKGYCLDFKSNKNLRRLNVPTSRLKNVTGLKELTIRDSPINKFRFSELTKIQKLCFIKCTAVSSLDFLPENMSLLSLSLYYMPKLIEINGIQKFKDTLLELEIENCKNISDLDRISSCTLLRKIKIDSGGQLSTASLFNSFNYLNHFVLLGSSCFINSDISAFTQKQIAHLVISSHT